MNDALEVGFMGKKTYALGVLFLAVPSLVEE